MITLILDTAYKNLMIGLYEDDELLEGACIQAFKKQSEEFFPVLEQILQDAGKTLRDVDEVVVTDGPGSYTGLRIAMTTAKLLATQSKAKLYTLDTLLLFAGLEPSANILMDARGKRAYAAHTENGEMIWEGILPVDQIEGFLNEHPGVLYGDASLIGKEAAEANFLDNAIALRPFWKEVEQPHTLVPRYLKDSDSYKV